MREIRIAARREPGGEGSKERGGGKGEEATCPYHYVAVGECRCHTGPRLLLLPLSGIRGQTQPRRVSSRGYQSQHNSVSPARDDDDLIIRRTFVRLPTETAGRLSTFMPQDFAASPDEAADHDQEPSQTGSSDLDPIHPIDAWCEWFRGLLVVHPFKTYQIELQSPRKQIAKQTNINPQTRDKPAASKSPGWLGYEGDLITST